jgi:membrane-associated phospholipid phosphatase
VVLASDPRRRWLGVVLLVALAVPRPGRAAVPAPPTVYDVAWGRDLTIIATAGAVAAGLELAAPALITRGCDCQPDQVDALDRISLHHESTGLARTSNVLIGLLLAAPFAIDAADLSRGPRWGRPFAEDATVLAETLVLSVAVAQAVKLAVQRPRPVLYRRGPDDSARDANDSYLSFYSGHASLAFAAGSGYAATFFFRHPDSAWRPLVVGGAAAAGAAMALLRIYAGRHFPTDVAVGALVGTTIGITVPLLHRRRDVAFTGWPTRDGALLALTGGI